MDWHRTIDYIPKKGYRILSIDMAQADIAKVLPFAENLGFTSEVVHFRLGETHQLHVLLWEGSIGETPSDMDDKWDLLWEEFGDAVSYRTGFGRMSRKE